MSALLSNGNDRIKAAHAAWKCNGDESARTLANRALKREDISFLIESYFGRDPEKFEFTREEALAFAAKQARSTGDPKISLDYFKLVVAMNGWLYKPAELKPGDPAPPVDDSDEPFSI